MRDIEQALIRTDSLMLEAVASDVEVLQEASRHIIGAGGKRIRPRVLFLAFQSLGGIELDEAIPLAAAVELVHTATLVHDDINDHASTRRGHLTVNERWGRTFALLTGDYLFTKVYSLMAPYGDLNKILAEATVALVEGETLQAAAAKENNLNRDIYQRIVAKKTASLFRASALLGAHLARGDAKHSAALGDYGFYLGLTFQIVDDLLDLTGDPRLMGKNARIDVNQGKGVAAAYQQARDAENGGSAPLGIAVAETVASLPDDDPFLAIKRRLIADGAVEEGRQMATMIAAQAKNALGALPQNSSVAALNDLVATVLERDH